MQVIVKPMVPLTCRCYCAFLSLRGGPLLHCVGAVHDHAPPYLLHLLAHALHIGQRHAAVGRDTKPSLPQVADELQRRFVAVRTRALQLTQGLDRDGLANALERSNTFWRKHRPCHAVFVPIQKDLFRLKARLREDDAQDKVFAVLR